MSYGKDPVVEEIRETRRTIFSEFGYDPRRFGKFLAERERNRGVKSRRTTKLLKRAK
mgnify:CR=1 FL=1